MGDIEQLLLLLTDSLVGVLIVPVHTPYVLNTMMTLGDYSRYIMLLCVVVGSSIGAIINILLGKVLSSVRHKKGMPEENEIMETIDKYMSKNIYCIILVLLFSWIPLYGNIITAAAAFFKGKFTNIILAAFISYAAYYSILLII